MPTEKNDESTKEYKPSVRLEKYLAGLKATKTKEIILNNSTKEGAINKKQLKTILIAIGILSMMLLFPPWQYKYRNAPNSFNFTPGPYQLIFMGAPKVPALGYNGYSNNAEIDWVRLILPGIVVVLIAFGLVLYYKERE